MATQQPVWKHVGSIGDVCPIAHGGGFVYEDETGVYPPEVTWFEPAPDEDWHKTEGATPVTIYRFILERKPENEWWYEKLADIATFTGQTVEQLQQSLRGASLTSQAQVYSDLIAYHGAENFDSYPLTMTEDEAYAKYDAELKVSLSR